MSDTSAAMDSNLAVGGRLVEVYDRGLLLLCRLRLVGKESGLDLDSEYAMLVRMEEGRVVWGRAFPSHAEAEEAAAGA